MAKNKTESNTLTELRKKAKAKLKRESIDIPDMSSEEVRELVFELRTHQIELEMQNEELRLAQEELVESRDTYLDLYDFAPIGYMTISHKGLILEANLTLADMLGIERKALLKKPISTLIVPDDQDIFYQHRREILESKQPGTCRLRMLGRGVDSFWVKMDSILIEANSEKEPRLRAVVIDITETKQSEDYLNSIFRAAPTGIGVVVDRVLEQVNKRLCQMTGYSEEELIDQNARMLYTSDEDYEYVRKEKYGQIANHGTGTVETRWQRKDGSIIDVLLSSTPMDVNDLSKGVTFTALDITDRKRTEQEIEKLVLVAQYSGELINMATLDGDMIFINEAGSKMLGIEPENVQQYNIIEVMPDHLKKLVQNNVVASLLKGETWEGDLQYLNIKTGALTDVHAMTYPVPDPNTGKPLFLANVSLDITKRKQAEKLLQESEEKFRSFFDNAGDAMFIFDSRGRYLEVNQIACERYGYTREEFIQMTPRDLVSPKYVEKISDRIISTLRKGQSILESVHVCKDGTFIPVELSSRVINYNKQSAIMTIARDLTERKHLEAQVQQVQKMEAIGTLAGGVAHDFNNLLMGILGNSSLLLADMDPTHPHYENLVEIEEHVKHAVNLTKQLLGFARGGKYEVKPTNLNELIKAHNRIFGRTKKEITIKGKYEERLWISEVDRGQIEQVLMNIYVNAWQAMPDGGEMYIQTENVKLDEDYTKPFDAPPGKYVKISVTDTGIGMDKQTQQKIFDPFYTTKEKERGTGMGLSSSYGIIKNHGGFVTVNSEIGEGSTFSIYLPVSKKKAKKEKAIKESILEGSGIILIIDDEPLILSVGVKLLKRLGYNTLEAENGKKGLDIYKTHQDSIDMVILDIIMPEMSGAQTYDALKEINPKVKVLLASGYSLDGKAKDILKKGCNGFIQKPFSMEQLSKKISDILGKK